MLLSIHPFRRFNERRQLNKAISKVERIMSTYDDVVCSKRRLRSVIHHMSVFLVSDGSPLAGRNLASTVEETLNHCHAESMKPFKLSSTAAARLGTESLARILKDIDTAIVCRNGNIVEWGADVITFKRVMKKVNMSFGGVEQALTDARNFKRIGE